MIKVWKVKYNFKKLCFFIERNIVYFYNRYICCVSYCVENKDWFLGVVSLIGEIRFYRNDCSLDLVEKVKNLLSMFFVLGIKDGKVIILFVVFISLGKILGWG